MSTNSTNSVGIIANPASGRDIRRLVAHGAVFNNDEKVNIVRRVLLGLEAVGVRRVFMMPDSFSIGSKALDGLQIELDVSILPMFKTFSQRDSTQAAVDMAAEGVGCIVTLGGDGTNRAVAKGCGDVPPHADLDRHEQRFSHNVRGDDCWDGRWLGSVWHHR